MTKFKALPVWARIGVVLFALLVGGFVYLLTLGVQQDAHKQTAIDGCKDALRRQGAAILGDPYASEFPGGWGVSGQALVGGQQVGFDCSGDHDGNGMTVDLLP